MPRPLARPRPRLRVPPRAALAAVAIALLGVGGWLWLRDSPVVQVRDVFITGLTSSEQNEVRDALREAALDMTTLHVREDALRAAVAPFTSVRSLQADPDFPHKLTIEVVEHAPVAALVAGGSRVPVAGDGLVLRGVRASRGLPSVKVRRIPAERLRRARPRAAVAVLAAAPPELRERSRRAWFSAKGLTVDLANGPPLIFGDASDAALKWASAARVLADAGAEGAAYLDVRVPGRVAAGGLAPAVDPDATATPDPAAAAAVSTPVPTVVAPEPTPTPTPVPTVP